jgi:purine-binding chemotaxis protein CheW
VNAVVIDEYMDALLGGSPVVDAARAAPAPGVASAAAPAAKPVKAARPKKHKPRAVIPPALATAVTAPEAVQDVAKASLPAEPPRDTPAPAVPSIVATPLPADMITDDEFESLLDTLHGAAAPGANARPAVAEAKPAPVVGIVATPLPAGMITDDEFESLLDTLHGAAAPGANALPAVADASAAPAASIVATPLPADMISDDEFEHLLDSLHGTAAPGTLPLPAVAEAPSPAAPAPVARSAPAPVAAPARPGLRTPSAAPQPWHPSLSTTPEPKHHAPVEQSSRWLHLRCSGQHYAVELLKVQEVMVPVPLLPMRGTGRAMLGVMNLRGLVVPVIDLGIRLGLNPIVLDPAARIVVLEQQGETLGLMVSAVDDVITLREGQIEPPEHARIGRSANPMFLGVSRQRSGGGPVILLDACALLETPT